MITPDLAASATVQAKLPRAGAKPAEGPAAERAFAAFVEGEPAQEEAAAPEPADLAALLDAALPDAARPEPPAETPDPAAPQIAAPSIQLAVPGGAAPIDGNPQVAPTQAAPVPAALPAAAPATALPPGLAIAAPPGEKAAPEGEPDAEPPTRALIAAAPPTAATAAADARPSLAPPSAGGFDLSLASAAAPGWRLHATSAEAHAALAPAPTQGPSPRDVAGQITVAIAHATQPQVEIRLDPPELGRVQIRLNPTEHGLQALVLADRPETQDFLRRHADALVRDLTDAGYSQVSLDFASGREAPTRDDLPGERRFATSIDAPAAPGPVREAPWRIAAGGLDIRL